MKNILAVTVREFRLIAEDRWTSIAMFLVPLAASVLLAFIYASGVVRDIPMLVVDDDHSAASRALVRAMDAHESIVVTGIVQDEGEIERHIRTGDCECAIVIPAHFERDLKRGDQAQVLCIVNGTNILVQNYVLKAVAVVAGTLSAGVSMDKMEKGGVPSTHIAGAYAPIAIVQRTLFNPAQNYGNFFIPGVLAAILQQIVVVGAALTWVREFRSGQIERLMIEFPRRAEVVAGKLLTYVGIGCAWSIVLFAGLFGLLNVPFEGPAIVGIIALLLMMTAMTLLAMMISALVSHRETAMQVVFIVSSPAFLLSGYTFPLMAMPDVARWAANLIPLTPFLVAWRRIVLYGAGFGATWIQLGTMALMGFLFCVVMLGALKHKRVV